MKNFILLSILILFLCSASSNPVQSQESNDQGMFLVLEESVAPDKMPEFVKVQSEVFEKLDELNSDMTFYAYRLQDFSFYWAIPIENFAGIDVFFSEMMENHQKLMEIGFDPADKFRDLSSLSHFVVRWNKELSYYPEDYEDPEDPDIFYEWAFIHLKSGHEKEAAEVLKKYQELYDSVEETYQWDVYEVLLGNQTPCWILESQAKTELDMRTIESELNDKHGEKFEELWPEFVKHVDKMEIKKGWYLPKWSHVSKE